MTAPSRKSTVHRPELSRRSFLGISAAAFCGGRPLLDCAPVISNFRRIYVSPYGSDSNAGTPDNPLATINGAFQRFKDLGAGDVIVAMPGVYEEAVMVTAGGDASGQLTLMSNVRHAAKIRSPSNSYSAVTIQKSYVTIDGFDVKSGGGGHGIEATFLDGNNRNNGPHHVRIRNNVCHDCAGSGISVSYGDFYRIEKNVCFRNCATNAYQGSGISVYEARAVAAASGESGTRIVVSSNRCYDNIALTLTVAGPHSDGNGIIIDDLRNTQKPNPAGSYRFRTLVENNVCYRNGGKGVHVFFSDNVTVRNNTCCYNNRDLKNPATWRGELSNVNSSSTVWANNIGVADLRVHPSNAAILDAASSGQFQQNVLWTHNLTFNGTPGSMSVTQSPANATLSQRSPYLNLLGVDPLFVKGGAGDLQPDFHLRSSSPARDAGTIQQGIAKGDLQGNPRIEAGSPDLGAFEYIGE